MPVDCKICGRELWDDVSVEIGIGPVCRGKLKQSEHSKRYPNMFGNRAKYVWGTDGEILWLKDQGDFGRSLTNDLENCLVEIQAELPEGKHLTDYRIMYRDSQKEWDAVQITHVGDLDLDLKWLQYSDQRGRSYWSQHLQISFYPLRELAYDFAKNRLQNAKHYQHKCQQPC